MKNVFKYRRMALLTLILGLQNTVFAQTPQRILCKSANSYASDYTMLKGEKRELKSLNITLDALTKPSFAGPDTAWDATVSKQEVNLSTGQTVSTTTKATLLHYTVGIVWDQYQVQFSDEGAQSKQGYFLDIFFSPHQMNALSNSAHIYLAQGSSSPYYDSYEGGVTYYVPVECHQQ